MFYYNYQEFWIQYYTHAGEKNISRKNYRYVFYLFIFISTNGTVLIMSNHIISILNDLKLKFL